MSYVKALYHIVINTRHRAMAINPLYAESVYRFITGCVKNRNCQLLRINGVENHIHMLIHLHPTVNLSQLIGEVKQRSSVWMKDSGAFPLFEGWGEEYFACTVSPTSKENVISYINHQKEHHQRRTFELEFELLVRRAGGIFRIEMLT
jgi:REP element-mobilizing transposase RayT